MKPALLILMFSNAQQIYSAAFRMITLTLQYSPSLVRRSTFAYLRRGFGMRGLAVFAALCAAALLLAVLAPHSQLEDAVSGAVVVFIDVAIALCFLHYGRAMAKLARMGLPLAIVQLTESGLRVSSQADTFSVPWVTVRDLWQFNDFWLIVIGKGKFITLPVADLSDEAQTFIVSRFQVVDRRAAP